MPNYNDNEVPKSWEVPDSEPAFPEGYYIGVIGSIHPIKGDDGEIEAVTSDIFIIKYQGTDAAPQDTVRITIKEGKVLMASKGAKLVERYPHPSKMPRMAWRARAFFAPFKCITEVETGKFDPSGKMEKKSLVDWQMVKAAYGTVFKFYIIYQKGDTKTYRNIQYESITLSDQRVPADDMKKIEEEFDLMRRKEEISATGASAEAPPGVDDLPF